MASWWNELVESCKDYGGIASVIGLLLTTAGFLFTLWRLKKVRQEVTTKLTAIGHHVLSQKISDAIRAISEVREAADQSSWAVAVSQCKELRSHLIYLVGHPILTEEERGTFLSDHVDLEKVLQFIIKERLSHPQPKQGLTPQKTNLLNSIVGNLLAVQQRIRQMIWEG